MKTTPTLSSILFFILLASLSGTFRAFSQFQRFDSSVVLSVYNGYVSALKSKDAIGAAQFWNTEDKRHYPVYDLVLAPPMDSMFIPLYFNATTTVTSFAAMGECCRLELKHQMGGQQITENRWFINENGDPKLANLLFILAKGHQLVSFRYGHIFILDTCSYDKSLIKAADSAVIVVQKMLGVPPRNNMKLYLVNSTTSVLNYLGSIPGRSIPMNNMVISDIAKSSMSLDQQIDVTCNLMQHEMVHVLLADTKEFGVDPLNERFIREGLATMLFGTGGLPFSVFDKTVQTRMSQGIVPSLAEVYADFWKRNVNESYAYAASFLDFLHHTFDKRTFQKFCRAFQSHPNLVDNVQNVLGGDLDTFDSSWRKFVQTKNIIVPTIWAGFQPF
ncbi:MAG: hypothetical protein QME52_03325 [Bacteroidota bacterium]|nr:hypothetical protein [Bacteroidota bacterium]